MAQATAQKFKMIQVEIPSSKEVVKLEVPANATEDEINTHIQNLLAELQGDAVSDERVDELIQPPPETEAPAPQDQSLTGRLSRDAAESRAEGRANISEGVSKITNPSQFNQEFVPQTEDRAGLDVPVGLRDKSLVSGSAVARGVPIQGAFQALGGLQQFTTGNLTRPAGQETRRLVTQGAEGLGASPETAGTIGGVVGSGVELVGEALLGGAAGKANRLLRNKPVGRNIPGARRAVRNRAVEKMEGLVANGKFPSIKDTGSIYRQLAKSADEIPVPNLAAELTLGMKAGSKAARKKLARRGITDDSMEFSRFMRLQKKLNPRTKEEIRAALEADLRGAASDGNELAQTLLRTDAAFKRGQAGRQIDKIIQKHIHKVDDLRDANFERIAAEIRQKTGVTPKEKLFLEGFRQGELDEILRAIDGFARLARSRASTPTWRRPTFWLRDVAGPSAAAVGVASGTISPVAALGVGAAFQTPRVVAAVLTMPVPRRLLIRYLESPQGLTPKRLAALSALVKTGTLPKGFDDLPTAQSPDTPQ